MKLSEDQLKSLTTVLRKTRETELNCNVCLEFVSEFAELELSNQSIPAALEPVAHHIDLCRECREEYDTLLKAIQEFGEIDP
jgi:hypothetical protein